MSRPAIAALTGLRFWLHIMLPAYKVCGQRISLCTPSFALCCAPLRAVLRDEPLASYSATAHVVCLSRLSAVVKRATHHSVFHWPRHLQKAPKCALRPGGTVCPVYFGADLSPCFWIPPYRGGPVIHKGSSAGWYAEAPSALYQVPRRAKLPRSPHARSAAYRPPRNRAVARPAVVGEK